MNLVTKALVEIRHAPHITREELAKKLGVSLATVKRELRSARAWLAAEMVTERSF